MTSPGLAVRSGPCAQKPTAPATMPSAMPMSVKAGDVPSGLVEHVAEGRAGDDAAGEQPAEPDEVAATQVTGPRPRVSRHRPSTQIASVEDVGATGERSPDGRRLRESTTARAHP